MKNFKKYLALGDSYTIGTGVATQESLPVQLAAALRRSGIPMDEPLIIARNGWTTADLAAGIQETNPKASTAGPFDLVTLLIGVNDQYAGYPIENYPGSFAALLGQALAFAGGSLQHVLVFSIPDWSVTPYATGRDRGRIACEIDAYNAVNRTETGKVGAYYADITSLTRQVGCNLAYADPAMLAPDGLHPSGKMVAQWVNLALEVIAETLPPE